jgi:hypothetical protein
MAYGASASSTHLKGWSELRRSLRKVSREAAKEVDDELKHVAEPVRDDAERLARDEITNIGEKWSAMRIGARARGVYVAPQSRRRGGSPRPNLGILLMKDALIPAVEQNERRIERGVEQALDRLLRQNHL